MNAADAMALVWNALVMTLQISAPMLLSGLIVGLAVSIFQTTTSIQDQTLTFVPKIIAILISVMIFGPWMLSQMSNYVQRLFTTVLIQVAPH